MPGYDVAALAAKTGKSASHIYARLSLLQLIPDVAQAFVEERITASHANLIARLPEEHQAAVFEQCWRKDWKDEEAHLLPAKYLSAWIETNLYLALAEAPFDREDATLNASAGACVTCPRRSGYNTSLFADVNGDQCLDSACYQGKVAAHIDRELATRPQLVQIETAYRSPKEQRFGVLPRHTYRVLDTPDNPDAEPPCPHSKAAMIVFGREAGTVVAVCTDMRCPVHDPVTAARHGAEEDDDNPVPVMEPAAEEETEEEAEQRRADYERRRSEHEAELQRREEERKAEFERQQKEREAERKRREMMAKARSATLDRILERASATFSAAQLRIVLRLLIDLDPYGFLEEVAGHFSRDGENTEQTEREIILVALEKTADDKLTSFALRLLLSHHVAIPREGQVDLLAEVEAVFAPPTPKAAKPKKVSKSTKVAELVKAPAKNSTGKKQKAA
jgi:ParB family chromosome partitioning protein